MSKRWFPLVTLITVNGSLFWHPLSAIAAPIPLTQATLRKLVNQVELIIKDQQKRRARVNDQLSHGDALQTKESSRAELKFNDGTLAKVGERATFRFTPNTRRFDLQNGNYLFLVPPGRGPTEFYTPNAKAGVKGSALFLKYDAATDTTIMGALTNNPLGPMEITTQGQTQQVYAGQMVTVIKDRIDRVETFDLRTFYNTSVLFKDLDLKDPDVQAVRQELVDALTTQIALPADTPDAQRQAQTPEALQPSTVATQPSVPRVTDPVGRTGLPTLDPVVAPLQKPPVVARPPIVDNPVPTPPGDISVEPPPVRVPVSPIREPEVDNPPVKLPPKPILPKPMDPNPVDPRNPREADRQPRNDRREPHNDRREPHNARPKVEPIVIPKIEVTIETPKKDIKIELPRLEITIDRPDGPGEVKGQPKLEISTPDKPRIPEVKLALPEVSKPEAPRLETPKPEAPKPEAPKLEAPKPRDVQPPTATLPAPTQPEIVQVVPVPITVGPVTPTPEVPPGPTIAPTDTPPTAVTPAVIPPVTPVVTPPVSAPPVTAPPVTAPPATLTPEVVPVVTTPPVTTPPVAAPPVTTPPVTTPPAVIPPVVTAPPVTPTPPAVPPVTPPAVTPPAATPPVEVPPTTPPVSPTP